jgi:hypothetical protein
MDKITATRVFEEELRAKEFKRIEKIIDSYSKPYRPEIQFLLGTIFTFDFEYNPTKNFCYRYHIVTFVTEDKLRVYYRRLYAQIYHPTWESKQLTQNYKVQSHFIVERHKYVFKYNDNLMNQYAKNSLTIDEFYNNTICFKSSEIYEIVSDKQLYELETIENENNIEL